MLVGRGDQCRFAPVFFLVGGIVLAVATLIAAPGVAGAGRGDLTDPEDVRAGLDLKAVTHAAEGSSIVHTAETYAPFPDESAVFKWGIDRDRDESFDLIVFTEWRGGRLRAGVEDAAGRRVADATVTRPAPTVIRVVLAAEALGGATAYRYAVLAEGDADGDGATGPDERDVAPDSGLVEHRLDTRPAASPRSASRAAAAHEPASSPSPVSRGATLPRTGPGAGRVLLPLAGVAFMAGGALIGMRGAR